jgi:hypothetical protein
MRVEKREFTWLYLLLSHSCQHLLFVYKPQILGYLDKLKQHNLKWLFNSVRWKLVVYWCIQVNLQLISDCPNREWTLRSAFNKPWALWQDIREQDNEVRRRTWPFLSVCTLSCACWVWDHWWLLNVFFPLKINVLLFMTTDGPTPYPEPRQNCET